MSKSNAFETALLNYLFKGVAIPGLGANLYVSLHTADPGETGTQATSECAYTGYARVAVPVGSGWSVAGDAASAAAAVTFGACTAGSSTATHFGIGTSASGAGTLLYSDALAAPGAISSGVTPALSSLTVTED